MSTHVIGSLLVVAAGAIMTVAVASAASPAPAVPSAGSVTSAAGGFTAAGELADARADHVSVLLPDGRVLVAGGSSGPGGVLASAEVWDPSTSTWTATGPLEQARKWHAAASLPGGGVLVTGGLADAAGNAEDFLASAEVWDAATGGFTAAGAMADPRISFAATLLPDGRVLVSGGVRVSIVPLVSAEVWDAADGGFTPTGALAQGRSNHTATGLPDGRVLVAGGFSFTAEYAESHALAELWDPTTEAFAPAGQLRESRMGHAAVLLADGRVLVSGGTWVDAEARTGRRLASAEVWDPGTDAWSDAGAMSSPREGHTATLLPDGRVLIVGGWVRTLERPVAGSSAEVWDPLTRSFSDAGELLQARSGHTAHALADGTVLIVGGWGLPGTGDAGPVPLAASETWTAVPGPG